MDKWKTCRDPQKPIHVWFGFHVRFGMDELE